LTKTWRLEEKMKNNPSELSLAKLQLLYIVSHPFLLLGYIQTYAWLLRLAAGFTLHKTKKLCFICGKKNKCLLLHSATAMQIK